tara:strand:- start:3261 stop:3395 length:135 start_codon:yes stop_codon:yes gene_type:complete
MKMPSTKKAASKAFNSHNKGKQTPEPKGKITESTKKKAKKKATY